MELITVKQLYQLLLDEMGPQYWPADSKEEIIIGAILVQNTAWRNVEYSLKQLEAASQFRPDKLANFDLLELQSLIRPSGFYKNKAKAIKNTFQWLGLHDFDYTKVKDFYGDNLRKQLLSLHGIGEETVDVLLLYIFDQKVFVADSYARRIFSQLNSRNISFKSYRQLKQAVEPLEVMTLTQAQIFHGLIDEFGKQYSRNLSTSILANYRIDLTTDKA